MRQISDHSAWTLANSAEGEAPEAPGPLDLPEHRFHDRLAQGVDGVPGCRLELRAHRTDHGPVVREWRRRLPVCLPVRGDVQVDPVEGGVRHRRRAEEAGISRGRRGPCAAVRFHLGEYRDELLLVVGRLGDIRRHDDLGRAIHRGLGVVGLDEALGRPVLHDPGLGVGEVPLGLRLRGGLP